MTGADVAVDLPAFAGIAQDIELPGHGGFQFTDWSHTAGRSTVALSGDRAKPNRAAM